MMNLDQIRKENEERRARKAAASAGDWCASSQESNVEQKRPGELTPYCVDLPGHSCAIQCYGEGWNLVTDDPQPYVNAKFIAAARNDNCEDVIDELLAAVEKLTRERDALAQDAWRWKWCEENVHKIPGPLIEGEPSPPYFATTLARGDTFAAAVDAAIKQLESK